MKKCPFTWLEKECSPDCALFMEVIRNYTDGKQEVIRGCVFVLDHQEHRNQSQWAAGTQKELGQIKNNHLYGVMATMGSSQGRIELAKAVKKNLRIEPPDNEE